MSSSKSRNQFEVAFRENFPKMVIASFRICGDKALAEDIVQSVFLKLYKEKKLDEVKNVPAYLRRSVVLRTINAIRDRKKLLFLDNIDEESAIEHPNVNLTDDIAYRKKVLHQAIDQLPNGAKTILILHRFEGLSYKEIASYLNISPKTVENQISRALKLLKSILPDSLRIK